MAALVLDFGKLVTGGEASNDVRDVSITGQRLENDA
jgi:hypothetical protein